VPLAVGEEISANLDTHRSSQLSPNLYYDRAMLPEPILETRVFAPATVANV